MLIQTVRPVQMKPLFINLSIFILQCCHEIVLLTPEEERRLLLQVLELELTRTPPQR